MGQLQEPVKRIDDAAAALAQRSTYLSDAARASWETGDKDAAKELCGELSGLRREAEVLSAQAGSIAAVLEKRLNALRRSDAEMAELIRRLIRTRRDRPLLLLPRL
ncbi:MAG: hypothetical protein HC869_20660 [Rhodospirillales bacterium]|nr:hypothetical protein [Rhodospirillales bacterium]